MQCAYVRDGSCFLHRAKKRAEARAPAGRQPRAAALRRRAPAATCCPTTSTSSSMRRTTWKTRRRASSGSRASEADLLAWLDRVARARGRDREGGLVGTVINAPRACRSRRSARRRSCRRSPGRSRRPPRARAMRVPPFFRAVQDFGAAARERPQRLRRAHPDQPRHARAAGLGRHRGGMVPGRRAARRGLRRHRRAARGLCSRRTQPTCSTATPSPPRRPACTTTARSCASASRGSSATDDQETICWLTMGRRDASPALSSAPLSVAETLQRGLFGPKKSVVLTSATLSTEDNFDYIKSRLGARGRARAAARLAVRLPARRR